jgi:hypothetical protein
MLNAIKTCTGCGEPKSLSEFWQDRRRPHGRKARCKVCDAATNKARFWANRETILADGRRRYHANPGRPRQNHLIRKYGLTLVQYAELLAAQCGKCAICGAPESEQRHGVFNVDHDHLTGEVRGLLCWVCNHLLGAINDSTETLGAAIVYLRRKAVM